MLADLVPGTLLGTGGSGVVEDLHHRLIRVGLDALAQDYGYALAGSYAVQVHQIVNRISDDVDLFAPD